MKKNINIVTIGGGTGSFTLLSGIKRIKGCNISAIVTTFDNGGSTGRLIDEFGILPVGDIRQCITALSPDGTLIRQLFTYRFDKGEKGLQGHSLGNLLLTGLIEILGSEQEAIKQMGKILHIKGTVLPVSLQKATLVAKLENSKIVKGDDDIGTGQDYNKKVYRIKKLYLEPEVMISFDAENAILNADYIIIGPGDLYTSILPNFIVKGTINAIKKAKGTNTNGSQNKAKVIYIMNLISKKSETYKYRASDYIKDIEKYIGKNLIDFVLLNNGKYPKNILKKYEKEGGYPIVDDLSDNDKARRFNVISQKTVIPQKGDTTKRALIRHDSQKLARSIMKIVQEDK